MTETKKDRLRRFIGRLRSEFYKQYRTQLGHVDSRDPKKCSYCYEGAMCEFAREEGLELERRIEGTIIVYDGNAGRAPHKVLEFFGLDSPKSSRFVNMNDGGKTFPEIADALEKEVLSV